MNTLLKLLNSTQTARICDRAPATVRAKVAAGVLKPAAVDAKGRLLFSAEDVEVFRQMLGGVRFECGGGAC